MANIFHASYIVSQAFGPSALDVEPPLNGYPHWHRGIDLVGPYPNCPVYAAQPGHVQFTGADPTGNYVIVLQDDQTWAAYWHLATWTCARGDQVDNTTQIGTMGNTGGASSTGYHTHFEIESPGPWRGLLSMTPIDPAPYLTDTQGDPHDDMTNEQAVLAGLVAIQHIDPATYPPVALAGHVARVNSGTPLAALYAEFIRDAGLLDNQDYNHRALREYYQANGFGDKADQTAIDRVQGGSNFAEVVTGDLAHDHAAAEQTNNLYHAAAKQLDTFSQEIHDLQRHVATLDDENKSLHIALEKTTQSAPLTEATEPVTEPAPAAQPDPTPVEDPASQPEPAKMSYLAGLYYLLSQLFLGR